MTKRALITGASRGIGKSIALELAAAGFDIAISARTIRPGETRDNGISVHRADTRALPGSLEETADAAAAHGGKVLLLPMDLTDRASVTSAADRLLGEWGGVDVIVHNGRYVGPGLMDVLLDTPVDAYEKFVEAHAIAPVVLTQALLPGMLERGGGTVVTITSSSAFRVPPGPAGKGGWGHAYAVGKAAGHQLVPTLHAEFADRGVRAFNVDPGFVATERNAMLGGDIGRDLSRGAPPSLIGSIVAWMVTSSEADRFAGEMVKAQELARARGMLAS